ncbi:hypothetical protein J2N86_00785 [Legionella lytica]|jgi:hypothetical protein|uniref:Coiled-coil protein n=1 Tax=Legionella lytica TaxID=96232 RepID=A0ABY4Y8F1_9GAMM|nr:hypothetical protein [Legionella lytica]USQ13918.1 hypothetical protein J2N86_00785 [Legionella lytica]
MTIFVKAAKDLINRVLLKSIEDSIAEDKSTLYKWFRDTELSEKQRELTRGLQKEIDDFKNLDSDEKSLAALKKLVIDTDLIVQEQRKLKQWDRGHLNKTLTNINSTLDRFYNLISTQTFKLTDLADNTEPFNILCFYAAYYLGENIMCPVEEDIFTKTLDTIASKVSSSPIEIRAKKEECLIKNLIDCKKKLDGLDTERDEYKDLCLTFVNDAIKAIMRENTEICEESKPVASLPIVSFSGLGLNVKASPIKPSRGRLRTAMQNAEEDIKDLCVDSKAKISATM